MTGTDLETLQSLTLESDRGTRELAGVSLIQFHAFLAAARRYGAEHPETTIRAQHNLNLRTGVSSMRVTWWPRGEAEHRG